jgi:peptide/nickel transport system permease protein
MVGWSLPSFWLGMMLILFFSLQLGWLPAQGIITLREELTGLAYVVDLLRHLILPAFTLSLWTLAMIFRQTRASVMEQLWQDYVVTARAKGLSENKILFRHALKNASLPIITVIGLFTGYMLGGAVLVEVVFGWPGLGRLTFEAIFTRDYPIIIGMTIIIAIMVIVVNLITDIIYAVIDPRVRYR